MNCRTGPPSSTTGMYAIVTWNACKGVRSLRICEVTTCQQSEELEHRHGVYGGNVLENIRPREQQQRTRSDRKTAIARLPWRQGDVCRLRAGTGIEARVNTEGGGWDQRRRRASSMRGPEAHRSEGHKRRREGGDEVMACGVSEGRKVARQPQ